MNNIFDEVLDHFGGIGGLAKQLKITRHAIYQWGNRIPELRSHQIEKLSGGKFTASALMGVSKKEAPKARRASDPVIAQLRRVADRRKQPRV